MMDLILLTKVIDDLIWSRLRDIMAAGLVINIIYVGVVKQFGRKCFSLQKGLVARSDEVLHQIEMTATLKAV